MKVQLAHLLQHLFHASTLEEVPENKIRAVVNEHPYFTAGHLLLSQKLKGQEGTAFDAQLQKTSLYFSDPLWMQWQLNDPVQADIQTSEIVAQPDDSAEFSTLPVQEQVMGENFEEPSEFHETEVDDTHDFVQEIQEPGEEVAGQTGEVPDSRDEEPLAGEEFPSSDAEVPEVEEEVSAPIEEVREPAMEDTAPLKVSGDSHEESPVSESQAQVSDGDTSFVPAQSETPVQDEKDTPVFTYVSHNANDKAAPLAFDPYYTIDYFASQGIKPPADLQPGDKLGKQLKSFTEWLKTMKRLPQSGTDPRHEDVEQQDIRRIAAGSLEEKEVVTETMAEVLVKQDKREEAIVIYEKLSLLDPSKRAYFAAKIDNLKVH